jgi:hypothetical protein
MPSHFRKQCAVYLIVVYLTALLVMSCAWSVTVEGVRIGDRIYCTLIRNNSQLQVTVALLLIHYCTH